MLEPIEDFIREIAAHLGSARNHTGTADHNDGPMPQAEVMEPESSATQSGLQPLPTFYLLTGQVETRSTVVAELVEESPSGRTRLRIEDHRRAIRPSWFIHNLIWLVSWPGLPVRPTIGIDIGRS